MYKIFSILTLIILTGLNTFGQVADTSFYPTGKVKEIKVRIGDKIVRAITYKPDGEVNYRWDIGKKTLESFTAITYEDTLAEYFMQNCPDYTLYQHYGNGPLMKIENYKDKKRDGPVKTFDINGKLIEEGQFKEWKKAGIWTYYDSEGNSDKEIHWFNHNYYDRGISIKYTVMPVVLTLLLIIAVLFLFLKYSTFSYFFISFSLFVIGFIVSLSLTSLFAGEKAINLIAEYIGDYLFPVLTTLVIFKAIFSLTALIFKRRTGVKTWIAGLFLIISILLCFLLFISYISSKLSGAMLG